MQKSQIEFREATADDYDVVFAYSILYIHHLIIKEGHRYQGCGGAFIDCAKRIAKELGVSRMGIDFWYLNEPARKCFSRKGFRDLQEIKWLNLSANLVGKDTVRA